MILVIAANQNPIVEGVLITHPLGNLQGCITIIKTIPYDAPCRNLVEAIDIIWHGNVNSHSWKAYIHTRPNPKRFVLVQHYKGEK